MFLLVVIITIPRVLSCLAAHCDVDNGSFDLQILPGFFAACVVMMEVTAAIQV